MSASGTIRAVIGIVGFGYIMWAVISPGEERTKQILKTKPYSIQRTEEVQKREEMMMEVLKKAAETKDNFARGYGSSK